MMILTSLLCAVLLLWMVARIWKANATLAVVTLVLWPVMVFALLRYWNDDDSDIRVPFVLFAPVAAYTYWEMFVMARAAREAQAAIAWLGALPA